MTRVFHLSSVHRPFDVRIQIKECSTLAAAGYETTFAVTHNTEEVVNNVRIVPIRPPRNRLERMLLSPLRLFRIAVRGKADIVHFHDAELIPISLLLRAMGKKVIYDVHEDLPKAILDKQWIPVALRQVTAPLVSIAEWVAAHSCTAIVAATPAIAERFQGAGTQVVQNFPLTSEFANTKSQQHENCDQRQICYVGGITRSRGAIEMIEAMAELDDSSVRLLLAGPVQTQGLEEAMVMARGNEHCHMLGWQSRAEVAALLGASQAGLVLFHPEKNHVEAQPNKLFEYMSAGLPVIASDFPLWRSIVADNGCGLLVDPMSPEKIAAAISWLLENPEDAAAMGARGEAAVKSKYNWESESLNLLALYQRIST